MMGLGARLRLATDRGLTLGTLAERVAAIHGDRVLLREPGRTVRTANDVARQVDRWAGVIACSVQPGDRVVIAVPNGVDLVIAAMAASRAGAVPVPVGDQLRPNEVEAITASAQASLVVGSVDQLDGDSDVARSTVVAFGSSDLAALFATSGTTGQPKLAELTHRGLLGSTGVAALAPTMLRRDEAVLALPLAHIMGFAAVIGLLAAGIPTTVLPRFRPPDVLDVIERRRATIFIGVPTMYRMLDEAGAASRDLRSVNVWASGADVIAPDLARRFQRFGSSVTLPVVGPVGQALFVEGYGMVELAGAAVAKVSLPFVGPIGDALGLALPGWKLRVVGDDGGPVPVGGTGELQVRGPGTLRGYFANEAATERVRTADGWVRTGDVVRRGTAGAVAFVGRDKDVVKHGGYSVYALDVQAVLEAHPAVAEAAVVGIPDRTKGEVPVAVVRLRVDRSAGRSTGAVLDDIESYAAQRLAPYQVPQRLLVVDAIPRTSTGKVQRPEVRQLFEST
jgi:acyl-CoA synthetase (AMP-forming)/AMP-acid ligase II